MPLRTLLLTAIVVPIAVFVVTPALIGLRRWMTTVRRSISAWIGH